MVKGEAMKWIIVLAAILALAYYLYDGKEGLLRRRIKERGYGMQAGGYVIKIPDRDMDILKIKSSIARLNIAAK